MTDPVSSFGNSAFQLSRNPLGIIALFIVFVYALSVALLTFGRNLSNYNIDIIAWFLVLFPIMVLFIFTWIVTRHSRSLYAPSDYKDEKNFVAVAVSLAEANARRQDNGTHTTLDLRRIRSSFHQLSQTLLGETKREPLETILWVDDLPENNIYERQAFEAAGLRVTVALSTEQALDVLAHKRFGVIISDMARKEGPEAGYELLDMVRKADPTTPFFIYAGSNAPEHKREALSRGAQGSTNDPQELFELVSRTLARQ